MAQNLTNEQVFRMGGKELARITRTRSTYTQAARDLAQSEINRRQAKRAAKGERLTEAVVAQAEAQVRLELGLILAAAAEGRIRVDACGAPVLI